MDTDTLIEKLKLAPPDEDFRLLSTLSGHIFPGECSFVEQTPQALSAIHDKLSEMKDAAKEKALLLVGKCADVSRMAIESPTSRWKERPEVRDTINAVRLFHENATRLWLSPAIHVRRVAVYAETMTAILNSKFQGTADMCSALIAENQTRIHVEQESLVLASLICSQIALGLFCGQQPGCLQVAVGNDAPEVRVLQAYADVTLSEIPRVESPRRLASALKQPQVKHVEDALMLTQERIQTGNRNENPWFPLRPRFSLISALCKRLPQHLGTVAEDLAIVISEDNDLTAPYVSLPILFAAIKSRLQDALKEMRDTLHEGKIFWEYP